MIVSMALMAVAFLVIYHTYMRLIPERADETRSGVPITDFFLLTFSSLTEPDPLPWFPKYSAGTERQ